MSLQSGKISLGNNPQTPSSILTKLAALPNSSSPITEGQILKGLILDILNQQITISLEGGTTFTGQLTNASQFSIGDTASFQVVSLAGKTITMKAVSDMSSFSEEPTIAKALEEAGLPKTERNFEVVKQLLDNQLSISKQSIQEVLKQLSRFPSSSVDTIITMNKLNIPMTESNVNCLDQIRSYHPSILSQLESVSKDLVELLPNAPSSMVKSLAADLLPLLLSTPFSKEQLSDIPQHTEIPLSSNFISELIETGFPKEMLSSEDFIPLLTRSLSAMEGEQVSNLFSSKELQSFLQNRFVSNHCLSLSALESKEAVDEFYPKLEQRLNKIEDFLTSYSKSQNPELINQTTAAKQNIDFMKALNQMFPYIQLPVKLQDKTLHAELFVYQNKEKVKQSTTQTSVLLHLDMDYLGETNIHISMQNTHIEAKFYLETEETRQLLGTNIELLKDSLNEKGFSLSTELFLKEKDIDIVNDFIDINRAPKSECKRYRFDIRA